MKMRNGEREKSTKGQSLQDETSRGQRFSQDIIKLDLMFGFEGINLQDNWL